MTVHVLHAGDGYTYLTRQVACGDHQRRRGEALADYYTAAGNPPGRWVGTGLAAMGVDGQVSEAQMKALLVRVCTPTPTPASKRPSAAGWTARPRWWPRSGWAGGSRRSASPTRYGADRGSRCRADRHP